MRPISLYIIKRERYVYMPHYQRIFMVLDKRNIQPPPVGDTVVKRQRGATSANKALTVLCALEKISMEPNSCMSFTSFVARLEVEEPFLGHVRAFDLARSLIAAGKVVLRADADGVETVYLKGAAPCP